MNAERPPCDEYKSEIMDVKTEALQKYIDLTQMRERPGAIEEWGKTYSEAFDRLAEEEPEFLKVFNKNPTAKEFEAKLQEYL